MPRRSQGEVSLFSHAIPSVWIRGPLGSGACMRQDPVIIRYSNPPIRKAERLCNSIRPIGAAVLSHPQLFRQSQRCLVCPDTPLHHILVLLCSKVMSVLLIENLASPFHVVYKDLRICETNPVTHEFSRSSFYPNLTLNTKYYVV